MTSVLVNCHEELHKVESVQDEQIFFREICAKHEEKFDRNQNSIQQMKTS